MPCCLPRPDSKGLKVSPAFLTGITTDTVPSSGPWALRAAGRRGRLSLGPVTLKARGIATHCALLYYISQMSEIDRGTPVSFMSHLDSPCDPESLVVDACTVSGWACSSEGIDTIEI